VHYFGFCRNDLNRIKQICDTHKILFVEDCAHAFHLGTEKEGLGITGDFSFYSVHKYLAVPTGGILKNISQKMELLNLPEEDKMNIDVAFQLLNSDNNSIAQKRKSNFNLYREKLEGNEGIIIMYKLAENEIPQTFPILVKNRQREALYFYLIEKNMPTTALYYRLIEQLTPENFPISNQISAEILNLPVHQDTTEKDIEELVNEIKIFLNKKL